MTSKVITIFSAGLAANPKEPEAAQAFVKFLKSVPADSAFGVKDLDPV